MKAVSPAFGVAPSMLLLTPSVAQEPPPEVKAALHTVEECYMTHAKIDGSASCQPPPALVEQCSVLA